ncbi:hypothetical protein PQS31_03655 [Luteimonas sp BLCC-B24]|uniref:hypothetical protein n=1 Tax=Luteimonas sp. BLCC-B24 TaxID=3025317 RepID=UPI00234D08A7|nr:hypothetical protein [Luteimonas sp. BLCC-B24]MDC7805917.1 hypothetical protein [Luteimonas sp. BLCC-B24]
MAASPFLMQLRQSRRASLLLFGTTLLALIVAAAWFVNARSNLAEAYQRLGGSNQLLSEARVREQEARMRVDYAESSLRMLEAARAQGLSPEFWGERLINLRQSQLSREETLPMLDSVARSPGHLFGADAFELSVTRPDEGLFDPPVTSDRQPAPLLLTLRGNLLFRTGGRAVSDYILPVATP